MTDPLVHLVMHRDRICTQDVWQAVAVARLRLRVAAKRRTAMETAA